MEFNSYATSRTHVDTHYLEKKFYNSLLRVNDTVRKIEEGRICFDYGRRPIRAIPADIVRVVSQISCEDDVLLCYKNIILNAIISLEKSAAFSSSIFLNLLRHNTKKEKLSFKKRTTEKEMLSLIKRNLGTGICFQIFYQIYESGSIFSNVEFFTSNQSQEFNVSISGGKPIEARKHVLFEENINQIENCRILFLDGIVEKVSEIHKILEESYGENVVLFAHGFSSDVAHTLSENFKSKKLSVVPVEVKDKANSWQFFQDLNLTSVRKENYVSLNTLSLEDLSVWKKIVFKDDKCTFLGECEEEPVVSVTIPSRFRNQEFVIEERIRSSMQCAQELSKFGVVLDEEGRLISGWKQYKKASESVESFKDLIENIGCMVTRSK